jgi:hypothetical protein
VTEQFGHGGFLSVVALYASGGVWLSSFVERKVCYVAILEKETDGKDGRAVA